MDEFIHSALASSDVMEGVDSAWTSSSIQP